MNDFVQYLTHPFTLGLLLGLLFFALSFYAHFKTKMEFRRYRKLLSDKMELESKAMENLRKEKEEVAKENENLRIKTAQTSELTPQKLERELEILARAEKQMMINAPGFAPAWETAKTDAMAEIVQEERGNTLPKRIFRKFFGSGKELPGEATEAIAESSEAVEDEAAEEPSTTQSTS